MCSLTELVFTTQVRRSGTTRDQIAANALLVQQSALHNLRALDELLSLSCKRGGAQAAAGHAVDALKELFAEYLLPDRRLVGFDARPVHRVKLSKAGDKQLLYWWVEDSVKRRYCFFACNQDGQTCCCHGGNQLNLLQQCVCLIAIICWLSDGSKASVKETHSHTIPKSLNLVLTTNSASLRGLAFANYLMKRAPIQFVRCVLAVLFARSSLFLATLWRHLVASTVSYHFL